MSDTKKNKMKQRFDLKRTDLKSSKGDEILVATGRLSMKLVALGKSPKTGKYVSPTYKIDEKENMQNFYQRDGKPLPLYSLLDGGVEKEWEQPALEGKTKEKNLYLIVGQGNDKDPIFYELRLWDSVARYVHQWCDKGELVLVIARKSIEKSPSDAKVEKEVWVVENLIKVNEGKKGTTTNKTNEKNENANTSNDVKQEEKAADQPAQKTEDKSSEVDKTENKEINEKFIPLEEDDDLPF